MRARSLVFPRLRLTVMTLLVMALVSLAALGIQEGRALLAAPSWALLLASAAFMLLLCREWFSPSRIELTRDTVSVKWNNWRVRGARLGGELSRARPRLLKLTVGDPAFSVDPVGPLHLAAMLLAGPLLSPFLPRHLSRLYFTDSRRLSGLLGGPGPRVEVAFPAFIFGIRRIRNVLEKSLE